mmetsp:Transcript_39282/g.122253  ORF Transcript_39282/g.122253 Transcript_39282/m.122253 type:complete len:267 (+) Transcript_39282:217-1017(+)
MPNLRRAALPELRSCSWMLSIFAVTSFSNSCFSSSICAKYEAKCVPISFMGVCSHCQRCSTSPAVCHGTWYSSSTTWYDRDSMSLSANCTCLPPCSGVSLPFLSTLSSSRSSLFLLPSTARMRSTSRLCLRGRKAVIIASFWSMSCMSSSTILSRVCTSPSSAETFLPKRMMRLVLVSGSPADDSSSPAVLPRCSLPLLPTGLFGASPWAAGTVCGLMLARLSPSPKRPERVPRLDVIREPVPLSMSAVPVSGWLTSIPPAGFNSK